MQTKKVSTQDKLSQFRASLENARNLQNNILCYGLKAAHVYVEDVGGDWMEKWHEEESEINSPS